MRPSKEVAVGIISYDCADHTISCLKSLRNSHLQPNVVVVCENGGPAAFANLISAVETAIGAPVETIAGEMCERVGAVARFSLARAGTPVLLLCATDNVGYAGGVNHCVDALSGRCWDAILILNPDTQVDPSALANFVAYAADESYGVIGCRLLFSETGRVQMYGCRWLPWIGRAQNIGLDAPGDLRPNVEAVERQIDFVGGTAMYVTRPYFETIGKMDETYFLYMEEVDFCFRRGRFRLGYAHDAIVRHVHGATTGANRDAKHRSALTIYLGERNKLMFTRKFFPARYPIVVLTTLFFTLLYLRRSGFTAFLAATAGWHAGVAGEVRAPAPSLFMTHDKRIGSAVGDEECDPRPGTEPCTDVYLSNLQKYPKHSLPSHSSERF